MNKHRVSGQDPFVVVGTVHGQNQQLAVSGPAEALTVILGWLHLDRSASAVWFLHPAWPETVTAVCRWRPSIPGIRQSRCLAHITAFQPGEQYADELVAYCGKGLHLHAVEWLNPGEGMPCPGCLMLAPLSPPATRDAAHALSPGRTPLDVARNARVDPTS